jgi:tetratricopeptide (TPR) repeat protein
MGMPPAAGGAPAGAMSAEATKLSEQVKTLEGKLKASPGDAATKKQLSAKLYELGTNIMNDPNLPPRQKYPDALKLYNQALAQDPANAEAKQGKDLIEGIYKQMGRPIPK